jgi:hypothetical protein
LEEDNNRFKNTVILLKEENKLLRETNQKIENELLSKYAELNEQHRSNDQRTSAFGSIGTESRR